MLITAAKQTIPPKCFVPHWKPGWDKHLKAVHTKLKLAHKQWIKAGRPRQSDHPAQRQYKEAKSTFRACLRARQREENEEFLQALDLDCRDSSKLFRQLRRARGQVCDPTTHLKVGSCTYQGDDLPSAWASYFESLAPPCNHDYDESFRQLINAEYESLLDLPLDDFTPFTEEEVDKAIRTLRLDKAAGPDGIEPEHLVFGGRLLVQHLTHLHDPSPSLNPLQGWFRQGYGCVHTAYVLQEAIQSLQERRRKAYVACLDV